MKKLISMVEFIDNHRGRFKTAPRHEIAIQIADKLDLYEDYAKFLNQKLNISQFVPAVFDGGKWVVLEKPSYKDHEKINKIGVYHNKLRTYQQAKENVLFDGFDFYIPSNPIYKDVVYVQELDSIKTVWSSSDNTKTIQDLIKYNPTLTAQGQKQAGL